MKSFSVENAFPVAYIRPERCSVPVIDAVSLFSIYSPGVSRSRHSRKHTSQKERNRKNASAETSPFSFLSSGRSRSSISRLHSGIPVLEVSFKFPSSILDTNLHYSSNTVKIFSTFSGLHRGYPPPNRQKRAVSDQRLAELQTLLALARIEKKYEFDVGQILRYQSIKNVSLYSINTICPLFCTPVSLFKSKNV